MLWLWSVGSWLSSAVAKCVAGSAGGAVESGEVVPFPLRRAALFKGAGVLSDRRARAERGGQSRIREGALRGGRAVRARRTQGGQTGEQRAALAGRQAEKRNAELQKLGVGVTIVCVGKKATAYFKRRLDRFKVAGAARRPWSGPRMFTSVAVDIPLGSVPTS